MCAHSKCLHFKQVKHNFCGCLLVWFYVQVRLFLASKCADNVSLLLMFVAIYSCIICIHVPPVYRVVLYIYLSHILELTHVMYSLVINKLMRTFMANISCKTAALPHLQTNATPIPNLLWLSWSLYILHFSYVTTPLQPNVSTPPLIPPSFIHAGRHPPPPSPTSNNGLPPVIGLSLGLYAAFLCAIVSGATANGSRQP